MNASCRMVGAPETSAWRVRDISRTGLLLSAAVPHGTPAERIGQVLTVDLELPRNPKLAPRSLRCRGTVVRVCETRDGVRQLALSLAHMEFCDAVDGQPQRSPEDLASR